MTTTRELPAPQLLTVRQACAVLNISRSHGYTLMDSGALPFVQLGEARRIARSVVDRIVAQAEKAPAA